MKKIEEAKKRLEQGASVQLRDPDAKPDSKMQINAPTALPPKTVFQPSRMNYGNELLGIGARKI